MSRIGSGFISDRIGGLRTLLLGSVLQALAIVAFLGADTRTLLYVVSAIFGLSQGGIVPSYTIIIRTFFPAQEAGRRVGWAMLFTFAGMALGGWMAGALYDLTGSYTASFINAIAFNISERRDRGLPRPPAAGACGLRGSHLFLLVSAKPFAPQRLRRGEVDGEVVVGLRAYDDHAVERRRLGAGDVALVHVGEDALGLALQRLAVDRRPRCRWRAAWSPAPGGSRRRSRRPRANRRPRSWPW